MDYLFITVAAVCIGINFCMEKLYRMKAVEDLSHIFLFHILSSLFSMVFFFCLNGFRLSFGSFGITMAFLYSLFCTVYSLIGMFAYKFGKLSIYTLFLMIGGMLLPYLYGIIFLKEQLSLWRVFGMVLLIGALIFDALAVKAEEKSINKKVFLLLCFAVFFLNGGVSIASKVHQISPEAIGTNDFIIWNHITKFTLTSVILCIYCIYGKRKNVEIKLLEWEHRKIGLLIIVICVIIVGVINMLMLEAAKTLPATAQFPFVTGGVTVVTALFAKIFFKEKINLVHGLSLVVTFAGTVLFLF